MIKSFLTWLLYALAFTPLVITKSLFFPYISGKSIFIRVVITLVYAGVIGYIAADKNFRESIGQKIRDLFHSAFGWCVAIFSLILIISTAFAQNAYRAFFGDIERAEGLVGLLFFIGFFFAAYLLFERKNWIRFFQFSMLSGAVLFVHMLLQFFAGVSRPSSFTGNPIYLAAFYLFVIFCAGMVYLEYAPNNKNNRWWRMGSLFIAGLSVLGIFITETRGAIVGLGVSGLILLLYFAVKGKEMMLGKYSLRKWSAIVFVILIVCGGIFMATKHADTWKKIPGLDRLATFTFQDASTQTRLISLGIGLQAINPAKNSIEKFLIGWGPENFNIAYNTYFNPEYFRYEQLWFDRAHNKLMDVLVMNGVLGLAAYLGIWGTLLWVLFKKKFSWESVVILFFGIAYFVQNLFVFDSVATYIPFFAFLAYGVYVQNEYQKQKTENKIDSQKSKSLAAALAPYLVGIFSLFFLVAFVWWTVIPFSQMRQYISVFSSGSINKENIQQLENSFAPYTYVQELIRTHFLSNVKNSYHGEASNAFMLYALDRVNELVKKEPSNPRYWVQLGQGYDVIGKTNPLYLADAERAYRAAHALAPKRQDIYYTLGYNLSFQKRFSESIATLEEAIALDPQVGESHFYLGMTLVGTNDPKQYIRALDEFAAAQELSEGQYGGRQEFVRAHQFLLRYFYITRNASATLRVVKVLRGVNFSDQDLLNTVEQSAGTKLWVPITF